MATGFPGYDSVIDKNSATVGEILRENGYATCWFGKNHNTPTYLYSLAGPFDQWPSGMSRDLEGASALRIDEPRRCEPSPLRSMTR